jgi:hypothetical protein
VGGEHKKEVKIKHFAQKAAKERRGSKVYKSEIVTNYPMKDPLARMARR